MIVLASPDLTAVISPFGAELVGLRHVRFGELLWGGDKAWWDRKSPLLFPVCGRSTGDHILVGGKSFPMPLHGFAQSMTFDAAEATQSQVRLTLSDSAASLVHYPFPFRLDVTYRLDGYRLAIDAEVTNTGGASLPASFGFHPGFVWPLPGTGNRGGHRIVLAADTYLDVLRADNGFMLPDVETMLLPRRRLELHDGLFEAGAMVMREPAQHHVRYEADEADCAIGLSWTGLSRLLFWTRPGAPFICVEPWAGEPDPAGFSGELSERPGIELIAPGQRRLYTLTIAVDAI